MILNRIFMTFFLYIIKKIYKYNNSTIALLRDGVVYGIFKDRGEGYEKTVI